MNDKMDISQLEQRIRSFLSSDRFRSGFEKSPAGFNQLVSALDILGDTNRAMQTYPSMCTHNEKGISYIIVYGVLQGLFLQQDSVERIVKVLDIPYSRPAELQDIRDIRNKSVGHPTNQGKKSQDSKSNFIDRSSLSPTGFKLLTLHSDSDDYEMPHIFIPDMISKQETHICEILSTIINELEKREITHREKYRGTKFANFFMQTNYYFQKIEDGIRKNDPLGVAGLAGVNECIEKFKAELENRNEEFDFDMYRELFYALNELDKYLQPKEKSRLTDMDAKVFVGYAKGLMEQLRHNATEIDKEYASNEIRLKLKIPIIQPFPSPHPKFYVLTFCLVFRILLLGGLGFLGGVLGWGIVVVTRRFVRRRVASRWRSAGWRRGLVFGLLGLPIRSLRGGVCGVFFCAKGQGNRDGLMPMSRRLSRIKVAFRRRERYVCFRFHALLSAITSDRFRDDALRRRENFRMDFVSRIAAMHRHRRNRFPDALVHR